MSLSFSIRPARPQDLEALLTLEHASFDQDRISRSSMRRFLVSPSVQISVAEGQAGALYGYSLVLFRKNSAQARLYSLCVAAEAQRQGVAKALIIAAAQAAHYRGASSMVLEVKLSNIAAQRLYEALGFAIFARRAGYYEDGQDALRLRAPLPLGALLEFSA